MKEYDFTLKFSLPDAGQDPDVYLDKLGDTCDDALIGIGKKGYIALDFTREGPSAPKVISSAIQDVKKAIPGAELVEATPDLVGLTDVADLVGRSRQNMLKLSTSYAADFPAPVYEGSLSLWHLSTVLLWIKEHPNLKYHIDDNLIDVATANMHFNVVKATKRLNSALEREIHAVI